MKFSLILFAAAGIFFTSCNDSAETTSSGNDSALTNMDTSSAHSSSMPEATMPANGLMKGMNDMMAKMKSMQMSGDFDMDFAKMMIEHHQGAIDMSEEELKTGTDEKMKATAQNIITQQKEEQDKLRKIIETFKPSNMKHGEGTLEKSMAGMQTSMTSMQMMGSTDKDFAMMMIPHHESAIEMAKLQASHGMNSELKQMAKKMISDQTKEINQFKNFLADKN